MTPVFLDAISLLDQDARATISGVFSSWRSMNGIRNVLRENIEEREHFLTKDAMVEILTVIYLSSNGASGDFDYAGHDAVSLMLARHSYRDPVELLPIAHADRRGRPNPVQPGDGLTV